MSNIWKFSAWMYEFVSLEDAIPDIMMSIFEDKIRIQEIFMIELML